MARTHYDVLGVNSDSPPGDVRRAYITLARLHHPDLNQGPQQEASEAEMQSVNAAWHVLGDADRRRDYDATLMFERSAQERADAAAQAAAPGGDPSWEPFDRSDAPDRDYDPTPMRGSNDVPRWVTLSPAAVFVAAIPVLFFGFIAASTDVIALGAVMGVFGVAGFILMPLIVMSRAERDPNL